MTTEEDISTEFSCKDDSIEKDQRRLSLINDPNYGIVLCFLDKFRSILDLPNYSFQRLEDHLVNYQERIPPRLIDFHFILLKRLSLAKNTQREKFDSIITKFASRFDFNDGDHLTTTGYLQANINIKIRILKNLLESQFDLNQTFTKTLIDKSAREIKSTPLGRDRFGVSYWLFIDTDCFIRLFREDADLDRTWTNVAKNRDEFEKFIKLLITDSVVRKKFSDWIIDYEPFSSLTPSNEFEECYLPLLMNVKETEEEEEEVEPIKKKRGRSKLSINNETNQMEVEIKHEQENIDDEKLNIPIKRKRGRPKSCSITPSKKETKHIDIDIKQENPIEPISNDDEPMKKKRGKPRSSTKEKLAIDVEIKEEKQEVELMSNDNHESEVLIKKKVGRPRGSIKKVKQEGIEPISTTKKRPGRSRNSIKSLPEIEDEVTPNRRGRKRKILIEENHSNDENSTEYEDLSIRRSSRPRKAPTMEPISVVSSKTNSHISSKKKRSINGKTKISNDQSITTTTTTTKSGRSRRRRKTTTSRRNLKDEFCLSSSSSDEHIDYLSEDEYDSDDYLPNPSQIEHDENFFELDEDNITNGEELRTAKTAQASTIITACHICSKSDRPEVLLLCDDCDDAYHIECLHPKLLSVPDGDWYCPLCEHKKLSNNLIEKLKELLINFNLIETKRLEHELKKSIERKLKIKYYTSDESITASEIEEEDENLENNLHGEESMLSISQTNDNSNISSTYFDDPNKNISQRGRHRRTRFDMNKMLNDDDDESDRNSNTDRDDNDDEYIENTTQITNFDLQIPKKMTRLFNHRYRPIARNDQRLKSKPIGSRFCQTSIDLNEKLGSPIIYINGENHSHQIKSVITNSNQTLKIVRRWNDVQRRNRLRTNNMKLLNETTSDCADENSVFCPDDTSPPRSNDSNSNYDIKEEDSTIIRSKITLTQPTNLLSIYKSSTKNIVKKNEVNFDQLTRDIQYAVSEANTLSTIPKAIDQQQIKRIQKTNFSPYLTKVALRPLPVLLPKPAGIGYKIFKSKDPPNSTSTTADLSNIILTPSSSSSLLDANDEQSTSAIPT